VAPEEKPALVRGNLFLGGAALRLMNDLMSAGAPPVKDQFVDWLNPQPGMAVLDVAAAGTLRSALLRAPAPRANKLRLLFATQPAR
jgi:hypothetical protein